MLVTSDSTRIQVRFPDFRWHSGRSHCGLCPLKRNNLEENVDILSFQSVKCTGN
jgi:hypothetical protein